MIGAIATSTDVQNNFGRYLNMVLAGNEVIITKNGKEVARLLPRESAASFLTDSLTGILKRDMSIEEARGERLKEKYETVD